jgi:hypothetical protein
MMTKEKNTYICSFIISACLLVYFVSVGCGKDSSTNSRSLDKSGWQRVDMHDYTLFIPPDWIAIDFTKNDWEATFRNATKEIPHLSETITELRMIEEKRAVKLHVFGEFDDSTRYIENFNIIDVEAGRNVPLDEAIEYVSRDVRPILVPSTNISSKIVDLPSGKFAKIQAEITLKSGLTNSVSSLWYVTSRSNHFYIITFSCAPHRANYQEEIADGIMSTFQFLF